MMPEAAQVTSLGKDGHGVDWSNPKYRGQQLVVGVVFEQCDGASRSHCVARSGHVPRLGPGGTF